MSEKIWGCAAFCFVLFILSVFSQACVAEIKNELSCVGWIWLLDELGGMI
ncbi:hypothetical protein [Neorickettsia findlayensis]|uniref:Uncharacterized protein n=1 Tax=Neorickettsia findlayensis TaxID=2686014 RepID=A0A6P1GA46_9RICK|nr:hypothetical protein [Neorickettsia findlayensis]QHD65192.1 hypothetical protein GP480_01835 [Neorickettsia findlayensis]